MGNCKLWGCSGCGDSGEKKAHDEVQWKERAKDMAIALATEAAVVGQAVKNTAKNVLKNARRNAPNGVTGNVRAIAISIVQQAKNIFTATLTASKILKKAPENNWECCKDTRRGGNQRNEYNRD